MNPATFSEPSGLMNDHEPLDEGRGGANYDPVENEITYNYCNEHRKQCAGGDWQPYRWKNYRDGWIASFLSWDARTLHAERRLAPQDAARLKARADQINKMVFESIPVFGNVAAAGECTKSFTFDCALVFAPGGTWVRNGARVGRQALSHSDEAADIGRSIGKCANGASSFAADTPVLMADGTTKPYTRTTSSEVHDRFSYTTAPEVTCQILILKGCRGSSLMHTKRSGQETAFHRSIPGRATEGL